MEKILRLALKTMKKDLITNSIMQHIPYFKPVRYRIIIKSRFTDLFEEIRQEVLNNIIKERNLEEKEKLKERNIKEQDENDSFKPIKVKRILNGKNQSKTVTIKKLPKDLTMRKLVDIFNEESIQGISLIYLPYKDNHNFGYAFVHFTEPKYLAAFYKKFHMQPFRGYDTLLEVVYCFIQGKCKIKNRYPMKYILEETSNKANL